MAKILYKLGKFIAQNKWLSVISWLILLGIIIIPLMISSPKFDDDITMNGLQSLDTNDKMNKEFHQDSEKASMKLVFHSDKENGITDDSTQKDIEATLDNIKQDDDYIQNISNPYDGGEVNDDNDTAIANISYVVPQTGLQDSSKDIINNELDDLKDSHDLQIEQTESGSMSADVGGTSEMIGIIVAFVILLITFGSLIAAGMPIISALIGLGSSVGIIGLLTYLFDIPNVTLTLAVMIGLAVGIDYSLFILFRYKELAKKGKDPIEAIGLAVGTAGSAVIFAGITVMIAVCGLSLVGIDFLATMGFASAISVLLAVIAALTLLPALISIFHKRIKLKSKKDDNNSEQKSNPWANFIVGKPLIATILSIIILILALLPITHMRLGMPDDSVKPTDSSANKAYQLISDNFGEGYNGQIAMLVNTKDSGSESDINRDLNNIKTDLQDLDNVDTVSSPQLNDNNNYALLSITPNDGPNAQSTNDLTYELRDYNSEAQEKYELTTEISGQSVINIDMSEKLNDAIPVFASVIVALAFVLLMFVFRSIIVPLKAVLGFVLSLAATLGFTTLIIQDGFLSGVFGIDTTGPIIAFLPVITIGLLFGLAIDYELFFMTRVHEEYSKTGDNEQAIKVGIKESGPVIVAAALIMFSVFIAFVFQDDVTIKSIGIALGFGVLFDAFVVRMTLIPALTKLFGKGSWYLPKWLGSLLPKIDVEGKNLESDGEDTLETSKDNRSRTSINEKYNYPQQNNGEDVNNYPQQNNGEDINDYPQPRNTSYFDYQQNSSDIDYEASYTQDNHVSTREDSNTGNKVERTTNLYKDLVDKSTDQDILFKALMLYARENNKDTYSNYINKDTNEDHSDSDDVNKD